MTIILFSDSDFFAMRECPYIMFGTIRRKCCISTRISRTAVANVWRRERLSETLGMTEHQFVEWCISIGNDCLKSFYITSASPYANKSLDSSPHMMTVVDSNSVDDSQRHCGRK